MAEALEISAHPYIAIEGNFVETPSGELHIGAETQFTGMTFQTTMAEAAGRIAIQPDALEGIAPYSNRMRTAILATTGLSNAEIGKLLCVGEDTVKSHLRHMMNETLDVGRRYGIARALFLRNVFRLAVPMEDWHLSPRERALTRGIAYGHPREDVSAAKGISKFTLKSHTYRMSRANGVHGNEQLVLGALMSGQLFCTTKFRDEDTGEHGYIAELLYTLR